MRLAEDFCIFFTGAIFACLAIKVVALWQRYKDDL
jgi:hypothetical protein